MIAGSDPAFIFNKQIAHSCAKHCTAITSLSVLYENNYIIKSWPTELYLIRFKNKDLSLGVKLRVC